MDRVLVHRGGERVFRLNYRLPFVPTLAVRIIERDDAKCLEIGAAVCAATYTRNMTPTAAQVLESAKTLSPAERAEIAEELVLTMHASDVDDATRHEALRAAIDVAVHSADAGEGIRIPAGGTREFVRELGREATLLVDSRTE